MPDTTNALTPYTSVFVAEKLFQSPNRYNGWEYRTRSTASGLCGVHFA